LRREGCKIEKKKEEAYKEERQGRPFGSYGFLAVCADIDVSQVIL